MIEEKNKHEKNSNFALIAIVAIVAIVALVVLIVGQNPQTPTGKLAESGVAWIRTHSDSENVVGDVAKGCWDDCWKACSGEDSTGARIACCLGYCT